MPHVVSRVNGLKIAVPKDARGVIHRFAIGGGGNELIFNPIKRSQFNVSKAEDVKPVGLDGTKDDDDAVVSADDKVELTTNVVEDDEPPKKKTAKKKTAKKKTAKKKAAKKRKEPEPELDL